MIALGENIPEKTLMFNSMLCFVKKDVFPLAPHTLCQKIIIHATAQDIIGLVTHLKTTVSGAMVQPPVYLHHAVSATFP